MDEKLLEILSSSGQIDEQKLLDYLQGKLSPQERNEIEKLLADSDFEKDAEEGLEQIRNKENLPAVMSQLNRHLVMKLSKRRKKNAKRGLPDLIIPVAATIIVLLLLFAIYFLVIKHSSH